MGKLFAVLLALACLTGGAAGVSLMVWVVFWVEVGRLATCSF
jgi:hypothetical protein